MHTRSKLTYSESPSHLVAPLRSFPGQFVTPSKLLWLEHGATGMVCRVPAGQGGNIYNHYTGQDAAYACATSDLEQSWRAQTGPPR